MTLRYCSATSTTAVMLTHTQALRALYLQRQGTQITPADVQRLLHGVHGIAMAGILYATQVKTAAAHRHVTIHKVTAANIQLANNLLAFTNVYEQAVKRSSLALGDNKGLVETFAPQDNYFEHTPCYSIVKHRQQRKYYLYAIFNRASSIYLDENGRQLSVQDVAQYLTPSAAERLLAPSSEVKNVTHGITHDVQVRTVQLEKIVRLRAAGAELHV